MSKKKEKQKNKKCSCGLRMVKSMSLYYGYKNRRVS